ncbi:Y-family DNA polymerase [Alicyclobacillus dauci]|uniref:UmuC domain-containing protein n=1 Tax=Alicyclobacillus dauci TaxID=1475485 RepID=A0ABY6Z0M8_9BACL|nr:hypothetical protein [Alicyclobacillus dauci]WAH35786.1 hypothetical protein NZD86_16130 [Alicyclobacillus dauci]
MKYTLFGQGEGLSGDAKTAYVTVSDDVIVDASVSAMKAGIRLGWPLKTALAMLPHVLVCTYPESPTPAMQAIYRTLWSISPFLCTTTMHNAFFLQIPGEKPPVAEVRQLLLDMEQHLTEEQRFRVGLAENPFLAQALVAWSRIERVEGALYVRVRRQQLLISPAVAGCLRGADALDTSWSEQMPIAAIWFISKADREALQGLGIHRLGDLSNVTDTLLAAHFGKESWLWRRTLEQTPGGQVQVNYPPVERRMSWRAPIGEDSTTDVVETLLNSMATTLCLELQKASAGALGLGLSWRTEEGRGCYEQMAKQPVYQPFSLVAQLSPGRFQIVGERLSSLDVYVFELRPLESVQSGFLLYDNAFYPISTKSKADLEEVRTHLMRKFPKQIKMGAKPTFREQRLDAIREGRFS